MVGIKRPLKTAQNEQPARAGPSTLSDTSDTDEPLAKRHKTQLAEASTSRLRPVTSAPSRASVHQPPHKKSKRIVDKGKGKAVDNDEHFPPTEQRWWEDGDQHKPAWWEEPDPEVCS